MKFHAGLLLLVAVACASMPGAPTPAPLFEFHSSPWINLHHYLLATAKSDATEFSEPAWTPAERAAWQMARDYYAQNLADHSPLFDSAMIERRDCLAALADHGDVRAAGLESPLAEVLAQAVPVYRRYFWPAHDRANRETQRRLQSLVDRHQDLAQRLVALFGEPWPAVPVRVDLTVDATWSGAFTTIEPTHVTLAASDPRNAGDAGLEVLFHESAHGLVGTLRKAIQAEAAKQNVELPSRDAWHVVLFYTVGEEVRRALASDYVPYAEQQKLYTGRWLDYLPALGSHWQPYLDGEISREAAIARLVTALGKKKSG